jgi:DNA helicase-2/ATP-dependent DNA helicase PcrA
MSTGRSANPDHDRLCAMPIQNVLCIAPAGCGKTTAIARRAAELVKRGEVAAPQKILALSFTNRARDNLATHLRREMGPRYWERVTVANFHGFAARLIQAHGALIGVTRDVRLPERAWQSKVLRDLASSWDERDAVVDALRVAKRDAAEDDVVLDRLTASGVRAAVAYELRLRDEGRLDYEDLLRHGQRLLAIDGVLSLYRLHFVSTFVDEIQDLTMRQFSFAASLGAGGLTAAGDRAQGIYRFAGAEPEAVFEAMERLAVETVEFSRSYRSAPRVLRAVNAIGAVAGSVELTCAHPESWPDEGRVVLLKSDTDEDEARTVVPRLMELQSTDPNLTIAVVARRSSRRTALAAVARSLEADVETWDDPTHHRRVVGLLRAHSAAAVSQSTQPAEALTVLDKLCRADIAPDDAELLDDLSAACEALADFMSDGLTLKDAVRKCRVTARSDAPVAPGLHLLNGHVGKGLQFDWVVVLGMEQGYIPDFRQAASADGLAEELRVLHVMASRARRGLVFTFAQNVRDASGTSRSQNASRWLRLILASVTETW